MLVRQNNKLDRDGVLEDGSTSGGHREGEAAQKNF